VMFYGILSSNKKKIVSYRKKQVSIHVFMLLLIQPYVLYKDWWYNSVLNFPSEVESNSGCKAFPIEYC
jgi:hypothetical protein